MSSIYALIDPRDNQVRYIGFTIRTLDERLKDHLECARLGVRRWVYNWIRQVVSCELTPIIEMLEEVDGVAKDREVYWIDQGKKNGWKLTNATVGGSGVIGYVFTDEARKKISKSSKAKWKDDNFRDKVISARLAAGYKHPAGTIEKMRKNMTGVKRSPEACARIGLSKKGTRLSDAHKDRISNTLKGRVFSEEEKAKISSGLKGNKNQLGKKASERTREKLREAWRLRKLGIKAPKRSNHHATK